MELNTSIEKALIKRLLIIEDDADTRTLLEEVFSMSGCDVSSAESAEAAIEYLDHEMSPDMILSDLSVPGADNHGGIVKIVRDHTVGRNIPIVLLSGHSDLRELASKLNVAFLQKPVDLNRLLDLIR
jgi:DNA-binding NtrC family response regulator